jgi:hypothetical protein
MVDTKWLSEALVVKTALITQQQSEAAAWQ